MASMRKFDPRKSRRAAVTMGLAILLYGIVGSSVSTHDLSASFSCLKFFGDGKDTRIDSVRPPIQNCTTLECIQRLNELQSKLLLEEEIYQKMYQKELKRTREYVPTKYERQEIVQNRVGQILANARQQNVEKHFLPDPDWLHKSHPEINIVGKRKTGTSQLYNLFATHRDVKRIEDDSKEHCSGEDISDSDDDPTHDTYEYELQTWHNYYYQHYDENLPRVNGCIDHSHVERQYVYSPPSRNSKFFLLLRDPADWAWAAYNFWVDKSWENYNREKEGVWVNAKKHYRSPEAFHEVILSGGKLKAMEALDSLRENSVLTVRRLKALVGDENLIILKNEDMTPGRIKLPGGVLDVISKATNLAKDGFNETMMSSRSNCNAAKGYSNLCTEERHNHGGYPVTNDRPMLEATRRFIYLQWHTECKVWAEEFGIVYPSCLAAIEEV